MIRTEDLMMSTTRSSVRITQASANPAPMNESRPKSVMAPSQSSELSERGIENPSQATVMSSIVCIAMSNVCVLICVFMKVILGRGVVVSFLRK